MRRRIIHAQCLENVVLHHFPTPRPAFHRTSFLPPPPQVQRLLSEFPNVLSSYGFTASKPLHGVRHHLLTALGPPVYSRPHHLDPEKLAAAKAKLSAMEKAGIIRRSLSHWSSSLPMVKKKDGGWEPFGDYRRLNNVTVPDRYHQLILHHKSLDQLSFLGWTSRKDIIRSLWPPRMFWRQLLSPPLWCSNFSTFPLGWGMLEIHSRGWWIRSYVICLTVLFTWTTFYSGAVLSPWPDNWPEQMWVCRGWCSDI